MIFHACKHFSPHKPWGLLDSIFIVGPFTHWAVSAVLGLMDGNGEKPVVKDIAGSTGCELLVTTPTQRGQDRLSRLWCHVQWTAEKW